MTCPFLQETQVRFCQMAGVRKMIRLGHPSSPAPSAAEKCTSPAYIDCPIFQKHPADATAVARCPWLQEPLMQYCGAAPVTHFVPYSESMLSRCGNGAFRYCEVFLSLAHPEQAMEEVEGVRVPSWLRYTSNHFWIDVAPNGLCHIGVDAFLAQALGAVEHMTYVWLKGRHRPAAVLTVRGVEITLTFPNPVALAGCNLYLRAEPSRCVTDPYGSGWMFEGAVTPETIEGLIEGHAAREWMSREHGRMNEFIHEHLLPDSAGVLSADGGAFSPDLLATLDREHIRALFQDFFSPWASLKRKP